MDKVLSTRRRHHVEVEARRRPRSYGVASEILHKACGRAALSERARPKLTLAPGTPAEPHCLLQKKFFNKLNLSVRLICDDDGPLYNWTVVDLVAPNSIENQTKDNHRWEHHNRPIHCDGRDRETWGKERKYN